MDEDSRKGNTIMSISIHSRRAPSLSHMWEEQQQSQGRNERHGEDGILTGILSFLLICLFIPWRGEWRRMSAIGGECHLDSLSKLSSDAAEWNRRMNRRNRDGMARRSRWHSVFHTVHLGWKRFYMQATIQWRGEWREWGVCHLSSPPNLPSHSPAIQESSPPIPSRTALHHNMAFFSNSTSPCNPASS